MRDVWITIAVLAVATAAIKAAGPVLVGGRALPPAAQRVIALLAPALLAALIVTQTFGAPDQTLTIDERAAGLAAAAGALAAGRSLVPSVLLAAATTALLRLLL